MPPEPRSIINSIKSIHAQLARFKEIYEGHLTREERLIKNWDENFKVWQENKDEIAKSQKIVVELQAQLSLMSTPKDRKTQIKADIRSLQQKIAAVKKAALQCDDKLYALEKEWVGLTKVLKDTANRIIDRENEAEKKYLILEALPKDCLTAEWPPIKDLRYQRSLYDLKLKQHMMEREKHAGKILQNPRERRVVREFFKKYGWAIIVFCFFMTHYRQDTIFKVITATVDAFIPVADFVAPSISLSTYPNQLQAITETPIAAEDLQTIVNDSLNLADYKAIKLQLTNSMRPADREKFDADYTAMENNKMSFKEFMQFYALAEKVTRFTFMRSTVRKLKDRIDAGLDRASSNHSKEIQVRYDDIEGKERQIQEQKKKEFNSHWWSIFF